MKLHRFTLAVSCLVARWSFGVRRLRSARFWRMLAHMDTPESLLLRLCQPGENAAWQRFVELYTPLLFYWARKLGCQESDAADLVQEVFTLLLRKLPEFRYDPAKSFRAWLRTVALNCWRNYRQKYRPGMIPPAGSALLDDIPQPADDDFWEMDYRRELMAVALDMIKADFQSVTWQAFWQCTFEERPAAEVGRTLGLTPGAVYMAKSRVLARLRQEMLGLLD